MTATGTADIAYTHGIYYFVRVLVLNTIHRRNLQATRHLAPRINSLSPLTRQKEVSIAPRRVVSLSLACSHRILNHLPNAHNIECALHAEGGKRDGAQLVEATPLSITSPRHDEIGGSAPGLALSGGS